MYTIIIILSLFSLGSTLLKEDIRVRNPGIDFSIQEEALDPEKCAEQIHFLQSNPIYLIPFIDSGFKFPRGIAMGNLQDLGNYHQCLGINYSVEDDVIQGKHCQIEIPLSQNITLPSFNLNSFDISNIDYEAISNLRKLQMRVAGITDIEVRDSASKAGIAPILEMFALDIAVCIPRVCSIEQAMKSLYSSTLNTSGIGFTYNEMFCRLPDDKPWAPADTVATVIFSIIALITILSTGYDVINKYWFKNDPKSVNPLYTSFSLYTNVRRLNTFKFSPGMLRSLDGIRAIGMVWVIVAHSLISEYSILNYLDVIDWLQTNGASWVTAGVYTVDTFFCLSGLVLVYSTAGKLTRAKLLKNLHVFYLSRIFRLWPILAFTILLQASYLNRILDGPLWIGPATQTNYCRSTWWLTLSFLQTYVKGDGVCFSHAWYVCIDFHCYLVSPLVLYWALGRSKKTAWIGLTAGLLVSLTAATIYNFIMGFPSGMVGSNRPNGALYMDKYYRNTLTRASPFFVGMVTGYILHLYRGKKLSVSWMTSAILWSVSATVLTTIFFYPSIIMDADWDQPFVDDFMNSFMRPAWSAAVSWMIVACEHGYGGPVNWFLTLGVWKMPSRLSYAAYILHFPLMWTANGALTLSPVYFTVGSFAFKAVSHIAITMIISYFVTLIIDSPCSTLCKLFLGGTKKQPIEDKKFEVQSPNIDTDNMNITKEINSA